jgi:hypothetical protein
LILALSAALLQNISRIFGNALDFISILAGFPVYYAARLNWIPGVIVYITAAALSAALNIGEALFFICTNGLIGLSLGIIKGRFRNINFVPVPSAILVIAMLFTVNYLFGISIFGYSSFNAPILQALVLFLPIYIYCYIYMKLAISADNLLHKYFDFRIY